MKDQDSRNGIVCLPSPNPEFEKVIFTKEKSRFLNLSKEKVEEHLRTLPVTADLPSISPQQCKFVTERPH